MRTRQLASICLLSTLLLFAWSLWHRIPDLDDGWLGEHAYWLAKLGYVKSELMRGITQQEERLLLYHKLFIGMGAGMIKLFGLHLYLLKSISLIALGGFGLLWYRYTRIEKQIFTQTEWIWSCSLILLHPLIFKFGFVYRPELWLMLTGFGSFILLEKAIEQKRLIWALWAGGLAGLCVLLHLNGIAFIAAGIVMLAWCKQWRLSLGFATTAFVVSLAYMWDFTEGYAWDFWLHQLQDNPYHDTPMGLQLLLNLLNEHMRFFHSPVVIPFSILFVGMLLLHARRLRAEFPLLLGYLLILVVSIGMIALYKTPKYQLAYLPFMAIMIVKGLSYTFSANRKRGVDWVLPAIGLLTILGFIGTALFYNLKLIRHRHDLDLPQRLVDTYVSVEPAKAQLIAPLTFVFNEIERVGRIQSETAYAQRQKQDSSLYGLGFLHQAAVDGIDCILLSSPYQRALGMEADELANINTHNWQFHTEGEWLVIVRRKP